MSGYDQPLKYITATDLLSMGDNGKHVLQLQANFQEEIHNAYGWLLILLCSANYLCSAKCYTYVNKRKLRISYPPTPV